MTSPRPGAGRRRPGRLRAIRSVLVDSLLALLVVAVVSLAISVIDRLGHVSNISNLYLIGTAALAARRGLYPAVLASVLAFLAYDWLFIPPIGQLTVDDPSEYVALGTLLVTSVLISQLLARLQERAREARRQQIQTELLHEISLAALGSSEVEQVYALALRRLCETLGLP